MLGDNNYCMCLPFEKVVSGIEKYFQNTQIHRMQNQHGLYSNPLEDIMYVEYERLLPSYGYLCIY
jgi:hypothetical protein